MNNLQIPVAVVGPGSQPPEQDDSVLDILQMPSGMSIFSQPDLPEAEDIQDLLTAKQCLQEVLEKIQSYHIKQPASRVDITQLDDNNKEFIDQVLGEGEVSVVCSGQIRADIQESVLAGIWRIKTFNASNQLLQDVIEISAIPQLVINDTFAQTPNRLKINADEIPAGVLNAPPLIAEINDKILEYQNDKADHPIAHVINLTLLPQTAEDLSFLGHSLGQGKTTILSRGYGNCRISSTATQNVWWVQYFNSQDTNILNSLEIVDVPNVACAAQEDITDSAERLYEILEAYQ